MRMLWWVPAAIVLLAIGGCAKKTLPTGPGVINWVKDPAVALQQAKATNKPIMLDMMAEWCGSCKILEKEVWSRADVAEVSKQFIATQVDVDKFPKSKEQYKTTSYPTIIFLTSEGKEISRVYGAVPPEIMIDEMQKALQKASR